MATSVIGNLSAILSLNASQFHSGMDRASKRMGKFRKNMNTMGRSLALPMAVAGGAMIKAASDIEKGMIGVQKTTGLADGEIKKLRNSLLDFSTQNNVTIDSLLETAKVAGQMGIQGQDAISKFTQAFAKLEVASDRTVAGEAGAQAFSKFLDLSGEGIEAAESMASAMVELGNTSKTTEGKILTTATEIVKKTNRFKLGGANILGLATALDEAGVKAEVAGSTMQKFFESVNEAVIAGGDPLDEFARLTGRSAEELQRLIKNNPSQILLEFSEGLKQANDSGENTVGILKMLGLGGIRAASTMNVLAERHVQLAGKMAASNDAQRQNIALQAEADAANRGTAAAMQKLINSLSKLATSRFFEQILKGFTGVIEILTKMADFLGNTAMPAITLFVSDSITAVMEMKDKVVGFVKDMIEGIERAIIQPLREIGEKVRGWTEGVTGFFGDMYEKVVGGSFVPDMMREIGIEFDRLPDIMVDPAETNTGRVTDSFRTMRNGISTLLSDIITGTRSFGDSMKSILGNIADNIIQKGIDRISDALTEGFANKISGNGGFFEGMSRSFTGGDSGGSGGGNLTNTAVTAGLKKMFGGPSTTSGAGGSAPLAGGGGGAAGTAAGGGITTLGGANAGLGGGISGASVTGGAQGAGLGGAAAGMSAMSVAGGMAIFAAGVMALQAAHGKSTRDKIIEDMQRAGPGVAGGLGLQAAAGEKFGFGRGANAGFAADFASRQGIMANEIMAGGQGTGIAAFKDLGLEDTLKLLDEAQKEFEALKKSAQSAFKLGQAGAMQVGQSLQDGVIDQTELADMGFISLGERIENTKSGVVKMGDVSVDQFRAITRAVNDGTFRLRALRGETRLNATEMQFLGQQGLTAASNVQSGFHSAQGSIRSFGSASAAALREIEGAANNAAGAVSRIGTGGEGPRGAASRDEGLMQQLRNDATRKGR